jgi:hypothetical protein
MAQLSVPSSLAPCPKVRRHGGVARSHVEPALLLGLTEVIAGSLGFSLAFIPDAGWTRRLRRALSAYFALTGRRYVPSR